MTGELGRYELLTELGRGGMAELFLGRLRGAGGFAKLVAIKRILPHLAQDKQFTEMFLDEGRIAARLSHPNVCQVFELGEADGTLFLAMEYLDGVSWDHLVEVVPRDPRIVAGVLAQAADGLHYAHTQSVIHRDVSPQNLFVTVDGICKVLDFGVSKLMTDGPRTKSGVLKGKLPYMSPEQIRGEPLDARADVFSLGVCAWEALAGRRLYDRDTDFLIWKAITEQDAPPLEGYPPPLIACVQRALSRDREGRQRGAAEFAGELRAAAGFASPLELAAAVRTLCGDRLADRARRVATVVNRPASIVEPTRAGVTLDLPADVRMRSEAVVVKRAAPGGSHAKTALIAAASAAVVTTIIVVIVMGTHHASAPIDAPPPDAVDEFGIDRLRHSVERLRGLEKLRDLAPKGTYAVDSTPAATIYADGESLGTTPVHADLEPGSHEIRAVLEDGRERTFSVDIARGRTTQSPALTWP